ncbi:MAG: sodium:solute symporter [Pseudomonadales bacterium]
MTAISTIDLSIILFYFALMLVIGFVASRKQTTVEDYYIAGGKLGTFSIACLWFASWIGGAAVVGVASKAYQIGISGMWYVAAMAIGCLLFGLFFAKRVKRMGKQYNALTYPDLIETRFDSRTRVVATITTVVAFVAYAAGQLAAAAGILHTLLGWDYGVSVLFSSAIIVLYTVTGGYLAVTYTDWLQVTILFIGIVFIGIPLALQNGGDLANLQANLPTGHFNIGSWGWASIAALVLSIGFSFFTAMDSYTRMFSARTEQIAQRGTLLVVVFLVPIAIGATWLGMTGALLFPGLDDSSDILSTIVVELFPVGLKGLVLVGLLAALMSTADICILTASANISRDVYQRYVNPEIDSRKLLRLSMVMSLVVGILAALLAWRMQDIIDILLIGFTVNSAALFLPSVAMIYSSKVNANAAFWSICLSLITVFFWYAAAQLPSFPWAHVDPLWPGLLVSFSVFTLLNRNPKLGTATGH